MFQPRGIISFYILKLILVLVSSDILTFEDSETIYEYNNASSPIGIGGFAAVFQGLRIKGNESEQVAFKEFFTDSNVHREKNIYELLGFHDSIPKHYNFFKETNKSAVLVTELLGQDLEIAQQKSNLRRFSTITVMKIGLQVLDALEFMHSKGIIHHDIKPCNLAMGSKNSSRVYIFDFGLSKNYTFNELNAENEDLRRKDTRNLACTLVELAQGTYDVFDEDILPSVNCRNTLKEFLERSRFPIFEKPNYKILREILRTELEKYKNHPNYDKFDWQIPQSENETIFDD